VTYLEPALPLLLLLGVVGIARAWRVSIKGNRPVLETVAIIGILLLSTNAFAWILSLPLEAWYDKNTAGPLQRPEAIVLLAGSAHSPSPNQPYAYAATDTYRRLQHGLWLFRHWDSSLPILVCGGTLDETQPVSHSMRRVLESEGVPPELLWVEDRSHNTHENAVYGAKILRHQRVSLVALVVEANAMWRAAAAFTKSGIIVLPAPVRFTELDLTWTDVFPSANPIALSGEHIHELVGLLWYRTRGWI
jgi:uncharacterized SAM-binding protein YcdF (DUF218 family)